MIAGLLNRLGRLLAPIEDALIAIAGIALFSMVVLITADVLMRYVLNSPLGWSFDLVTRYLVPIAFFLAVSQTLRLNEHVRVDIFASRLSPGVRNAALAACFLAALVVLVVIIWQGCESVTEAVVNREESPVGQFQWPTWPSLAIMPAGVFLLACRVALRAAAHATLAFDPASPVGSDVDDLAKDLNTGSAS